MKTISISPDRIIQWMNVIRSYQNEPVKQFRVLENFWESQIKSKVWLLENIINFAPNKDIKCVYIFGGWYGILAQLLSDFYPDAKIFSIDQDPECEIIGKNLLVGDNNITFVTKKMEFYDGIENINPSHILVINTSIEHIDEHIFNMWFKIIPAKTTLVLQSNNFFDCEEHIRCSKSLEEFEKIGELSEILMTGSLDCKQFTRYMLIGRK